MQGSGRRRRRGALGAPLALALAACAGLAWLGTSGYRGPSRAGGSHRPLRALERSREEDVGITAYIGPDVPGFAARFKQRKDDFQVHEVDLDGVELRLSELISQEEVAEEVRQADEKRCEARAAIGPGYEPEPALLQELEASLGKAQAAELVHFLQQQRPVGSPTLETREALPKDGPPPFLDVGAAYGSGSRGKRRAAHEVVRRLFAGAVRSKTVLDKEGKWHLRFWMEEEKEVSTGKRVTEEPWPQDRPPFLYFRLYKEDCNTAEAVANIAASLGRHAKQFHYAGLKDRRATTVQLVSAPRVSVEQMRCALAHRRWDQRIRISNLEYRATPMRLGMLKGNRFSVVLRGVPADDVASGRVDRAFAHVAEAGFLNYFGLQRFGARMGAHAVGAALLGERWDEAVHLVMGGGRQEAEGPQYENKTVESRSERIQRARNIFFDTGDARKALEVMPRSQHEDRQLLLELSRKKTPKRAFRRLPHQVLSLYLHAAQSLVWNVVLSRRLRDFGMAARPGDLVRVDSQEEAVEGEEAPPEVREIASEEEAKGYGLGDIVLPLPGANVSYPAYLLPAYKEAASEFLGLSLQDFEQSSLVRLTGVYRPMAIKPGNLQWSMQPATAGDAPILQGDVEELLADSEDDGQVTEGFATGDLVEGKACVVFHCTLPSSVYLTMLFRELTKQNTGFRG